MATKRIIPSSPGAPDGNALALLRIPHAFTQDRLLTTADFIRRAKEYGRDLTLTQLQELHSNRLLLPLFRISDYGASGRRVPVHAVSDMGPRANLAVAAKEGKAFDCLTEGYSVDWPYEAPEDQAGHRWWNGFLFSSWQLLDLEAAQNELSWRNVLPGGLHGQDWMLRGRSRTRVLSALASRYLPQILGRLSIPLELRDGEDLNLGAGVNVKDLLEVAGFEAIELQVEAERLLRDARHRDPLKDWWPLIRHANYSGWEKLRGPALECLQLRIAAEVLLRAHEDITTEGVLEPLPNLEDARWHPLHDRVTPRESDALSLDRALAQFGLSPHPCVLILLEGETEMTHVPKLLALLGLDRPDRVRVQNCRSSNVNAQLISRYAISPRLGRQTGDIQRLDVPPTALMVAMDPENRWNTEDKRNAEGRRLQKAIREEVERQGGVIIDRDLEFLVNIFVWGEDSYEIANFDDDELVSAVTSLAESQANNPSTDASWETRLREALERARVQHEDIQLAIGPLGIRENKIELAELLWPGLMKKYEEQLAADEVKTPVLRMVEEVRKLVAMLQRPGFVLRTEAD